MVVWGNAEGGGVTDGHGEGKTGAGVHEGEAVLHSAVPGREGNSFDQPSGREKKTLRGSSGDEHMQMTVQALQDELRIQRHLNQLFQQDSNSRTGEPCVAELTEENFQRLHTEHERQAKELFLLRKTLEEMELRIETQKQTLNAQDESTRSFWRCCRARGFLLRLLRRTMREQGDWQRQRCMSTTSKAFWSRRKKRTLC
ncbi:ELKS/Rab6-interacting/CAST family member 1-like isoform 1-T14 [Megaptera novaeangliae]